jgi:hypothetical protein
MNRECGKVWSRRFLNTTFSQSFLQKDWRKSREKLAFDRETALLPATQEILERRLKRENLRNQISFTKTLLKNAESYYRKEFQLQNIPYHLEPADLRELRRTLNQLNRQLYNDLTEEVRPQTTVVVNRFVRACPSEDCRGFLSDNWKCGLCKVDTCSKCHVIKTDSDENHTCNPDDVATATLLNRDTKPCPKCHTGIFKIDGCDQMWCTQCHTAFSWKTGDIETKIHNPHYYEWQRRNNGGVAPRVPGDVPHQCAQDLPLTQDLFRYITRLQLGDEITTLVGNIIRDIIHLKHYDMTKFQPQMNDNVFQENRILYLKKDITKEFFIRRVLMENKKREFNVEIRQVLDMFVQVSTDIIHRFGVLAQKKKDDIQRLKLKLDEIESLRQFTNAALKDIYTGFKYKIREIGFLNETQDRSYFEYRTVLKTIN